MYEQSSIPYRLFLWSQISWRATSRCMDFDKACHSASILSQASRFAFRDKKV